jgi:hypothetical protein
MHAVEKRVWLNLSPIGDVATDRGEFQGFMRAVQFEKKRGIRRYTLTRWPRDQVESFSSPMTRQIVQQT